MFKEISAFKKICGKVLRTLTIKTTGKKNGDGVPVLSIIGVDSQAGAEVNAKPFY